MVVVGPRGFSMRLVETLVDEVAAAATDAVTELTDTKKEKPKNRHLHQ